MHSSRAAFSSLHTQHGFTAAVEAPPGGFRSEARFEAVGDAGGGEGGMVSGCLIVCLGGEEGMDVVEEEGGGGIHTCWDGVDCLR